MPYSNLPDEANKIFEKVYNDSIGRGKSKEYSAKVAWTAVKNAGYKRSESGEWVKGKSEFAEFSMAIVKASFDKENQVMKWRSVNSDTDPDLYDESMSTELFQDFVDRIEKNLPVPEQFREVVCEDSWCGGMPYLSIAHYKGGTDKKNIPGEPESVYLDGKMLKSVGVLYNNRLGKSVFDALNRDLYKKKSDGSPEVAPEDRIRISIGFLDLQHKHLLDDGTEKIFTRDNLGQICQLCSTGIGRKIYTKGQLVHLALTRVPVNPRTLVEVDKSMGAIITKKDDAKSIVGEDLVDELEEKSLADGILVVKADGTTPGALDFPDNVDKCYDPNTGGYDQECIDDAMMGLMPPMRNKMSDNKKLKARTSGDDSLTDRVDGIRQAFYAQFPSGPGYGVQNAYVEDIFEDFVIVCAGQDKYRVPYTESDDNVSFGTIDKWRKVREETSYVDEKSDTVSKAVTKSEPWGDESASSYLVVGDPKHPTTWHLPVKENGKISTRLMGRAKAELTTGGRSGKGYLGPSKAKALAKLKSLYRSQGMEWEKKSNVLEDSMGEANEVNSKKKGKPEEEEIDTFDDEGRIPKNKEAYGQGKARTMRKGDEKETEKEDEEETAEDEKKEDMKAKKSLMSEFSKVADKIVALRSAGITGKEAEAELQPLLNGVGSTIERALTPNIGSTDVMLQMSQTLKEVSEVLAETRRELAVAKAQAGKSDAPKSPFTPAPRSIRVEKSNPTQSVKQLSQIEKLAKRSVGLHVDE